MGARRRRALRRRDLASPRPVSEPRGLVLGAMPRLGKAFGSIAAGLPNRSRQSLADARRSDPHSENSEVHPVVRDGPDGGLAPPVSRAGGRDGAPAYPPDRHRGRLPVRGGIARLSKAMAGRGWDRRLFPHDSVKIYAAIPRCRAWTLDRLSVVMTSPVGGYR